MAGALQAPRHDNRRTEGTTTMLDAIVRYLHDSLIPFRLASYPSAEHLPAVAHPLPPHGLFVQSRLVLAADKLVITCFPADENMDLAALGNALAVPVLEPTTEDLPPVLQSIGTRPPALGGLFGFPVIADETLTEYGVIVFRPFERSDFLEIPYEDYARLERPRVASFIRAGELSPAPRRTRAAAAP
jgi:hypothetical protein